MAGARQVDPADLVNPRGGRARGTAVPKRPNDWEPPALPREVAEPRSVLLPPEITSELAARLGAQVGEADPMKCVELMRAELADIGSEAQARATAAWDAWWASEASIVCVDQDLEPFRDWISCVFRRAIYEEIVHLVPLVVGSHEQVMTNPLARRCDALSKRISKVEDRFGMNSISRFRLHFERPKDDDEDPMEKAMRLAREKAAARQPGPGAIA